MFTSEIVINLTRYVCMIFTIPFISACVLSVNETRVIEDSMEYFVCNDESANIPIKDEEKHYRESMTKLNTNELRYHTDPDVTRGHKTCY